MGLLQYTGSENVGKFHLSRRRAPTLVMRFILESALHVRDVLPEAKHLSRRPECARTGSLDSLTMSNLVQSHPLSLGVLQPPPIAAACQLLSSHLLTPRRKGRI